VPVFAPIRDNGINTYAIVGYTQHEVLSICEFDLQLASERVPTGVADSFISDAVDLITDDGVHPFRITRYGNIDRR
jgi:hypothetical protein